MCVLHLVWLKRLAHLSTCRNNTIHSISLTHNLLPSFLLNLYWPWLGQKHSPLAVAQHNQLKINKPGPGTYRERERKRLPLKAQPRSRQQQQGVIMERAGRGGEFKDVYICILCAKNSYVLKMTISHNVHCNKPGKSGMFPWDDFPADFLLLGCGKHGVFPSFLRGHLRTLILPSYDLAPPAGTIVGSVLLLGRRQGLPTIFNTSPLL